VPVKEASNEDFKKNLEAMLANKGPRPTSIQLSSEMSSMKSKSQVKGFGSVDEEDDDNFFDVKKRKQIMTITQPRKATAKYNVENFDF
jgi:Uri superfamily endonuclease